MVYVVVWVGVPCRLAAARRRLAGAQPVARAGPRRGLGGGAGSGAMSCPQPLAYPVAPRPLARRGRRASASASASCAGRRRASPAALAVLMLAYVVVMLVGMSLYGVEAWTRNADPLGVYFGCSPRSRRSTRRAGALYARPPVVGAGRIEGSPGTVAVLLAGIGVTAFDGAGEGPLFNDLLPHLQDAFRGVGFGASSALELGFVVGLLVTVGLVAAIWAVAVAGMPRADGKRAGPAARALAGADPRRLRRRALLLAARLQRPGPGAARVGPARGRQRPVRHGGRDDRLRPRLRHGDLVRAGGRAGARPRCRAGARP